MACKLTLHRPGWRLAIGNPRLLDFHLKTSSEQSVFNRKRSWLNGEVLQVPFLCRSLVSAISAESLNEEISFQGSSRTGIYEGRLGRRIQWNPEEAVWLTSPASWWCQVRKHEQKERYATPQEPLSRKTSPSPYSDNRRRRMITWTDEIVVLF